MSEFPLRHAKVYQSIDMRNAPRNFFVAVAPCENYKGDELLIDSVYEWEQAVRACTVLK